MTVEQIRDCLERERIRATYGAVGAVIGRPAQSVGAALGNRRRHASWVVNARTGEPTDYDPSEKHPDLHRTSEIIRTEDELRRLCAKLCRGDTSGARPRFVTHTERNKDPRKPHEAEPLLAIGADGCSAGWFFVEIKAPGTFRCGVVQSLRELIADVTKRARVLVDIPIGLPDGRYERECDQRARRVLGEPRRRSVFRAPTRAVLDAESYNYAKRVNLMETGVGLTKQAFGILGKCREVDQMLREDQTARSVIREVHPEVCFWAFAGRKPMRHYKKDDAGYRERLDVLKRIRPAAAQEIERTLGEFKPHGKDVARDDAVDAMVAALTAAAQAEALRTLPVKPPKDACGLPMEMVYVAPDAT